MRAHGSFAQDRMLPPEDLECMSAAFELTLRYLHDHQFQFDLRTARDYVARLIMERAGRARCPRDLFGAAIRALEENCRYVTTRRAEP